MRLALLVTRVSQFPILEPVARAAHARGHAVLVFLDHSLARGPKLAQAPLTIPHWWSSDIRLAITSGASGSLDGLDLCDYNVDALVKTYAPDLDPSALRRAGWHGLLCHVQGAISDLMILDPSQYDRVYTWSDTWARLWTEWPEQTSPRPLVQTEMFRAVGFPVADLLGDLPLDSFERFGILPELPVVVYAPFPASSLRWAWWSHGIYTKPWPFLATERRVVAALRDYCKRAGALLVVKGLHRRGVESWIQHAADVTVRDDIPGEPTLLRLLQSTDCRLLVHHLSTSVSEATACGVPSLCIAPPRPEWLPQYAPRLRSAAFAAPTDGEARSFYCWWPVSASASPAEVVDALGTITSIFVRQDTAAAWRPYREEFFGEPPYRAGERIVEDLEGAK